MSADETNGSGGRIFATTHWTVVLRAGGPTSEGSAAALAQLCGAYWYPLYSYARRSGIPVHDAEDLTQSFFAYLLEKHAIARADRRRGRFRNFLLASFKNFLANERARHAAAKRGGGRSIVPFDELEAEHRFQAERVGALTPEGQYDKQWAVSLLNGVMAALRAEYARVNKSALFDSMRAVVWGGDEEASYAAIAQEAGLSEGALRVAVHRLRKRLRESLRHEVAQTVATPAAVDDELRHLLAALAS